MASCKSEWLRRQHAARLLTVLHGVTSQFLHHGQSQHLIFGAWRVHRARLPQGLWVRVRGSPFFGKSVRPSRWLVFARVQQVRAASRARLTNRSRRTAAPPLNSSVSRQSVFPSQSLRARVACWLRIGCAHCVVLGWPALRLLMRLVVCRILRALVYLTSSCFAARAVCRNVAFVASGSFAARRPHASRHCRAFKVALSCRLPTA